MIAAASSDMGGDTSITIWKYSETSANIRPGSGTGAVLYILKFTLHAAVIFAATIFLSQKLPEVSAWSRLAHCLMDLQINPIREKVAIAVRQHWLGDMPKLLPMDAKRNAEGIIQQVVEEIIQHNIGELVRHEVAMPNARRDMHLTCESHEGQIRKEQAKGICLVET
jgi:hypothetical protein